jgi:hypothetical protein
VASGKCYVGLVIYRHVGVCVSRKRRLQTIIKQFKEGGTYKGNTSTRRPKKLGKKDLRIIYYSQERIIDHRFKTLLMIAL